MFVVLWSTSYAQVEFSTAGFFSLDGSGRKVESMNPVWQFHKGDVKGAEAVQFNDSLWSTVSLPNGMEYLPVDASGGINYRGAAWYRKHFTLDAAAYSGKRLVLYFEAIMGKSKVWINGVEVAQHFGGFMPIGIDITDKVNFDKENVISVMTDNSDDPIYPPGKPQAALDFCYFGGIYRDCWLISTAKTYITDANMVDKVADGGLMVHYTAISDKAATVNLSVNLQNDSNVDMRGSVEFCLEKGVSKSVKYNLPKGENKTLKTAITINDPHLWSPDSPYLYDMKVLVKDGKGRMIDGYRKKIGVRSIEFSHEKGFILNGKDYPRKLIGANRHQDFAIVGNALSNNLHWRDAAKLREAGMDIIRNAHYPQDPAFMDACDALGLFVIVNTPGWQFWNKEPIFEQRVYSDIRAMVRRDRNHPSIIMWSIGNEVREQGAKDGAQTAKFLADICREEDNTRPTTSGFNNHEAAIKNGLADVVDLVGFNYKPHDYVGKHKLHPNYVIYGSETASTVSSRGDYMFPVKVWRNPYYSNFQVSSYDLDCAPWASTPDTEFVQQADNDFVFGEFVWTGFDYLGEPTPYNEGTPARSSYFGIVDLAGMKKDRFYLYQSNWSDKKVLHLLPHWNWNEGANVPVFCYTNYPKAELFVNGKSQGVKSKNSGDTYERYRLMWKDVTYEPGEIMVVAYNEKGEKVDSTTIRTASESRKLK
ncbi:MAG: glycoside hydrolase family 2 TIM barrel-domain containing protein, partial [Rikenellaceae bacterium]